jgi:hypothetical protein
LALVILAVGCSPDAEAPGADDPTSTAPEVTDLIGANGYRFPLAPPFSSGDLDPATVTALDQVLGNVQSGLEAPELSSASTTSSRVMSPASPR